MQGGVRVEIALPRLTRWMLEGVDGRRSLQQLYAVVQQRAAGLHVTSTPGRQPKRMPASFAAFATDFSHVYGYLEACGMVALLMN